MELAQRRSLNRDVYRYVGRRSRINTRCSALSHVLGGRPRKRRFGRGAVGFGSGAVLMVDAQMRVARHPATMGLLLTLQNDRADGLLVCGAHVAHPLFEALTRCNHRPHMAIAQRDVVVFNERRVHAFRAVDMDTCFFVFTFW